MSHMKALADDLEARGLDPATHGPTVGPTALSMMPEHVQRAYALELAARAEGEGVTDIMRGHFDASKVTLDRRREEARAQEEMVRYSAAAVLVEREAMMRLAFESPEVYERVRKAVERVELEARGGEDL